MFFSFSLFPPGISARCSRSAFPPGVSARHSLRRCLARGTFPRSVCLWGLVRFCRRFCLAALLRVSVRHFRPAFGSALPPVIPGLRSRPAFPSGGAWLAERFRAPPAFGGLSASARLVFCMRLLPHTAKNAPAGRRLRQRRNPRRTGCKVTYNSLIIAAFTIYSQFLQQRLRSP